MLEADGQNPNLSYAWPRPSDRSDANVPRSPTGAVILRKDIVIAEQWIEKDHRQFGGPNNFRLAGFDYGNYVSQEIITERTLFHEDLSEGELPLPWQQFAGGGKVTVCDARITMEDGTVIDLDSAAFEWETKYFTHLRSQYVAVHYKGPRIRAGDIVDVAMALSIEGRLTIDQWDVREQHPIRDLNLFVTSLAKRKRPMKVITYGGFNHLSTDTLDGTVYRHWKKSDIPELAKSPFGQRLIDAPCFSTRVFEHDHPDYLASWFRYRYPYFQYSPARNWQAFANHVERRRRVVKGTAPLVADIMGFLKDSIAVVPETELPPGTSVGVHFHNRVMSNEQIVVLYRQLFNILDVPLYACFTRDRYSGMFSDTLYAEDVDAILLAFKAEDERWHYVMPNSSKAAYLLDEVPYWLAGQPAFLVRISETERKDGAPERTVLPIRRHRDNLQTEHVLVEFSDDLRTVQVTGRGTLSGMARMSMNATWLNWMPRPDLIAPHSKWNPLAFDSTAIWPSTKQVYRFGRALPASNMVAVGADGITTIDLIDMLYREGFGRDPRKGHPLALLPYPFTQRQDIMLSFPFDVELVPGAECSVSNTIGQVAATITQIGPRMIHWHLDLVIANTHLDVSLYKMYEALLEALGEGKCTRIALKRAGGVSGSHDPRNQDSPSR
ncbi:MAG: hypothetical protein IPM12_15230 [Flavobacteriales bacterium]|jgi:hypothetical protein|nr:hypothetical protein [Flavobacteriales bacterium]MBK9149156.1 hypothetical protein [Flavobacteriales bacterium]